MTTLGIMKAEIADDLERTNLTTTIASEVGKAIRYYQNTRFYFNETRDETFATVSAQKLYASADDTAIPKFIEIDQISILDGTEFVELDQMSPKDWEALTASGLTTGRPTDWCYFDQKIGLYPIPDAIYTVRLAGHFMEPGPTSDSEANNVWMTDAFDLIRARATSKIAGVKLRDYEMVAVCKQNETEELNRLKSETAARIGTGFIVPTQF